MATGRVGVVGKRCRRYGGSGPEGTQRPTVPGTPNVAGVIGTSDQVHGVIGTTNDAAGVIGFSTYGVGIVGSTSSPAGYAGAFYGAVQVNGTLTTNVKNGVVPFPDGSQRLLHCMESPEHWFEDFGSARLARGRAVVKIDANFAKVIKRSGYRVFITPEGDCRGLYVRRKSANSFDASSAAANPASRFPTVSSAGARTSRDTDVLRSSTRVCRCQPQQCGLHGSPRRRRQACVRSPHAWRRKRGSGRLKAPTKAEHACARSVQGPIC